MFAMQQTAANTKHTVVELGIPVPWTFYSSSTSSTATLAARSIWEMDKNHDATGFHWKRTHWSMVRCKKHCSAAQNSGRNLKLETI
jgi:hypothetical protein